MVNKTLYHNHNRCKCSQANTISSLLPSMAAAAAAAAAAVVSNINGHSNLLPHRSKPLESKSSPTVAAFSRQNTQDHQPKSRSILLQASRRASLGLIATTLLHGLSTGESLAEQDNNGWWINGPLPVPTVANKIANEETGTRSFLRNGIYIANIGSQGSMYRIRMLAFDLLALGDLLGQDAWSSVRKYLCLKSTIMYYDFDKVITAASEEQKQPLTTLANRLFDSVEKLEDAVKKRSDSETQSCYEDTTVILKEVMARMA